MGSSKTSTQESAQQIDPMLRQETITNSNALRNLASMGYNPYEGTNIAGFTDAQKSAMDMSNGFAAAFGMSGSAGSSTPEADTDNPYGISGYSTHTAMGEVDPEVQAGLDKFYETAGKKTAYQAQPSVSGGKK